METPQDWALILGASSGFGEATALRLAHEGYNIFGVHLDRKSAKPHIDSIIEKIKQTGQEAYFCNINASADDKRQLALYRMEKILGNGSQVRVLFHSLAFGTLKPVIGEELTHRLDRRGLEMTLEVMANTLVYWAQDLVSHQLMREGGRIFAMTSAGSEVVWKAYGAVSAAKSALESYCRQLAVELAPTGITVNALMAGVTDTPALRKIPGSEQMIEKARQGNPYGRLTTPEDVANAVAILSRPESAWMTGNVIRVDGGESITG